MSEQQRNISDYSSRISYYSSMSDRRKQIYEKSGKNDTDLTNNKISPKTNKNSDEELEEKYISTNDNNSNYNDNDNDGKEVSKFNLSEDEYSDKENDNREKRSSRFKIFQRWQNIKEMHQKNNDLERKINDQKKELEELKENKKNSWKKHHAQLKLIKMMNKQKEKELKYKHLEEEQRLKLQHRKEEKLLNLKHNSEEKELETKIKFEKKK